MKEITITVSSYEGTALVVKKPTAKLTNSEIAMNYETIFDLQADGYVEEDTYAFEYFDQPGRVRVTVQENDDEITDISSRFTGSNDAAWISGGFKIEDYVQKPFVIGMFKQHKMEVTYKFEISDRAKFNARKLKLVTGDRHVLGLVSCAKIVYDGKEIEPEYDIVVEYDRESSRINLRAL